MKRRVVVTGLGCVSPVGNTVKETWNALLEGKSGVAPITLFDASTHKTKFAAEVKGFDPATLFGARDARKMDRFVQLATAAAIEALGQSGLVIDDANRDRVGILIGTGIGGVITMFEQHDVYKERGADRISPFLIPMMISDPTKGKRRPHFVQVRVRHYPSRTNRQQYPLSSLADLCKRQGADQCMCFDSTVDIFVKSKCVLVRHLPE